MKKLNNKKGFTLIEMLVVIAIIAILVAIIIPVVTSATAKAAAATNAANLRSYKAELVTSYLANGEEQLADFECPDAKECGACEEGEKAFFYIKANKDIDVWYAEVAEGGSAGESSTAMPEGAHDINFFANIAENGLDAAEEDGNG
ncbi:MAG: prepilin-type N-terminal cleavage/methylation domain-containing protein [Oscillospiraceae bacterium]|nr:prepilin-type N-terminal cleavage/methylation domain-containing protein [Oscillospiraceae bacterium]